THRYEAPGQYTVTLTSFNNGCPQTISKTQYIDVKPPMADFEYDIDCSNLQNVNFTNTSVTDPSKGAISFAWQFGDPSSNNSTDISPSFIYPGIGSYSVTLTATNGGCTHSVTKIVTLADVSADFEASETTVCRSGVFTIEAVKSNPDLISQYEWTINGGTPFIGPRSFETSFPANGVYSVGLRIIDINGCEAMLNRPDYITVQGPFASFTAAATNGCPFEPVTFTDNSDSDAPLISWTFNFGNGDTQSFGSAPFTYHYTDTGWYNVTLTVTDNDGCSDAFTLADAIHITKPTASFSAERTLFCPGGELAFYDSSKGYTLTHSWNFGDQGTSTDPSPVHIYQGDDAVYSVELIVTDMYGCKDTLLKQDYITIVRPKPAFDLIDSSSICPPLETKFFRKGTDYESFYWDFGDGTVSELDNPVNFFNTYGSYEVRLYVTGYGGCVEYASQQVNVYNPYSYTNISMSPITSCNELTVDFGINTPPATRFVFYYGDGTSDTTGTRNLSHFYDFPRNYAPYLILTDSLDCTVTVGGPNTIRIIGAVPIFSPDKKNFCDESIVYFRNFTQGNDPIVSTVWDFADGTTSTDQEPTHFFNTPGVYPVTLTVTTEANCTKSFIDTIRVYNTPEPIIFSDDLVCLNELIAFQGQLALADTSITWNWNLGNGVTTQNADTSTSYTRAGTVTVNLSATNLLGCSGSTSKSITVAPLPEILFESDPVVPVGSSITIPVTYSPNVVQWIWTPSNTLNCNNCGNPVATPQFTTTYRVDVTDANGCKNSSDVTVKVICNEENYFVPNTFSPNNDGINDVFYPRGKGIHRVESMKIFNRWGQLIFERRNFMANDANAGWDGTIKGKPAEADTYVYIVEFICENATIIPFKGNVTLIR
ncbi:MAG TPA: PKD domain-containing protein, partial [Parasegetibacter sp.]